MMKILKKHYWFILAVIVLFCFLTRVYRLDLPREYVFDEVYHAVTAKLIARNDPRAYEWWNPVPEPNTAVDWLHPPYAKYTQAFFIKVFGENSFGWRFSSVIFGAGVTLVTALLAKKLFKNPAVSVLAAVFTTFDGLLLVQSRIAMNDIHVTFAILLTLLCYAHYRTRKQLRDTRAVLWLFLTGVAGGVAMGTKWSGAFVVGIIWGFAALDALRLGLIPHPRLKGFGKSALRHVIFLGLVPVILYLLAYTHMFLQGKTLMCQRSAPLQGECYCSQTSSEWVNVLKSLDPTHAPNYEKLEARGGCKRLISHFSELHQQIWWYQTTLKATHSYQSRPLQWFLNLRPVWMSVKYEQGTVANIYNLGNPVLFWAGDVAIFASIISLAFFIWREKTKKKLLPLLHLGNEQGALVFLLISYFAVWLPWQLSPRIMFFYHYTPAVPFLAILLAYWLYKIVKRWPQSGIAFATAVITAMLCIFIVFYPNWIGLPVSQNFADRVYFLIKSWK